MKALKNHYNVTLKILYDEKLGIIISIKLEYFHASYKTHANIPELMILIEYKSCTKSIPVWTLIIYARKSDG